MSAGANKRVKLFSALNVLGWVVVMPVLLVAIMNPFVNFSAWPDALADRASGTQVALMPPRLTEHGSLPQLTEAPAPSAAVPEHRQIAVAFTPAPASGRANRTIRTQGGRPAPARRRVSAPARSRRPTSNRSGGPALRTPAATTPVAGPTAPSKPTPAPPAPQPAAPSHPHPGSGNPDKQPPSSRPHPGSGSPQNQGDGNGSGKKTDEPRSGSGRTGGSQSTEGGSPSDGGNGRGRGNE